ncbi:hypothetical protein KDM41_06685 [bacterium]|nr:hypothetical protein [bacterium]
MRTFRTMLAAALLLALAAALLPGDAQAIPAFARTHKLSCTTCHAPFPRLKEFGNEFAANGFTIPEQEKDRDFISAGDDLLKLNRTFPLAVRFDAFAVYESDAAIDNDLQIPYGLKLLSGGNVASNVGYYFYFYMNERGEVAGIEDAYIHFNNVGGRPFDIMVGQFQTSDPLMKRELRLTYEDYLAYKTKIGDSRTTLTYDRGLMMTYDIESTGTGLVGMVVNGNGKPEAGDDHRFDDDGYKNYGLRLTQALGEFLSVGYFGYTGREETAPIGSDPTFTNKLSWHGPDLTLGNGMFDLTAQYLIRRDTNPTFVADAVEVETTGIVAELVFAPRRDRSRKYFTLLYNRVDSDWDAYDYETWTVSGTHLLARNLRGTVEYTRDVEHETDRVAVGIVTAY